MVAFLFLVKYFDKFLYVRKSDIYFKFIVRLYIETP